MNFKDRKIYVHDPAIFGSADTRTILKFVHEAILSSSPEVFRPLFFEVDRNWSAYDGLWHYPLTSVTQFSQRSPIKIPAINTFEKPKYGLGQKGRTVLRRDTFTISALELESLDYFPTRGDVVFWNGYRYSVLNAIPDPNAYFHQTGIWTSLAVECVVTPEGDAKPFPGIDKKAPAESSPALDDAKPVPVEFTPEEKGSSHYAPNGQTLTRRGPNDWY